MNAARHAMEQLQTWPGLTLGPASCGTGHALRYAECEIVHFHSGRDADLHLTGRVIRTLGDQLGRSTAIRLLPQSQWVTVHLDHDRDADTLLGLVSLALRAHASCTDASAPPCNLNRITFPDRNDQYLQ
ncbi:luciferase family protein [Streptomyces sp. NPDC001276]|uniref:luciferase domain-containing protein n=1 Tax=Streptomyces sp. NPDC001276 TaxID=3364555 RepID=UPI0036CD6870